MSDLIVVGAGVAGLVVAHEAARAGWEVDVIDAADRAGGLLRRGEVGGVAIDLGAESFATRNTAVADLIADAGLGLETVSPSGSGAFLAVPGDAGIIRAALPVRTVLGIPADPAAPDVARILGPSGVAAVAAERALPPLAETLRGAEPSLAELVTLRCGVRLLERIVDPLCRSVYSRPAAELTLSRVHPQLWQEALTRGSLLASVGALVAPAPRAPSPTASAPVRAGAAVGGIAGGMWQLTAGLFSAALAAGARVRTGAEVTEIIEEAGGVRVRLGEETLRAPRVVVATGPATTVRLLSEGDAPTAPPATPVRVVAALVHAAALNAHPVGSGVIVAPAVASAAKALTHANAKWAWLDERLPVDHHILRLSAREAAAGGLDTPAELAAQIALLTGIPLPPSAVIAHTDITYVDAVTGPGLSADRRATLARAGIHVTGAAAAGAGLASVIPHARALAREILTVS